MAFLWFGGFKPPLPPQLWRCSWPRREGRAGVSGEQRRNRVWPRPSKHTHTHACTTFGFVRLGAGGTQLIHRQSALLVSSQSLRAQVWRYRSAGLRSACDCFWGGVKMLAMSVLKRASWPYYIKKKQKKKIQIIHGHCWLKFISLWRVVWVQLQRWKVTT